MPSTPCSPRFIWVFELLSITPQITWILALLDMVRPGECEPEGLHPQNTMLPSEGRVGERLRGALRSCRKTDHPGLYPEAVLVFRCKIRLGPFRPKARVHNRLVTERFLAGCR